MLTINCEQGTPEWEKARIGIPTASRFSEIVTSKGKPSESRKKYMRELAGELIAQRKQESFKSKEMERGNAMEGEARALYEFIKGVKVEQVGFCLLDDKRLVGGSPDGLVGSDGGLEIKTAKLSVQVERLLKNELPSGKMQQIHGYMYITGRKWWDWMSYSSGLNPLIIRVERDEAFQAALGLELKIFSAELEKIVKLIK